MRYVFKKAVISVVLVLIMLITTSNSIALNQNPNFPLPYDDVDPLVDVEVTVDILKIRSLERFEYVRPTIEKIDLSSDPDFFVKVFINDEEFVSDTWEDTKYVYEPDFSATLNVPDEENLVNIRIELWDWNQDKDKLCDIGPDDGIDGVDIVYDLTTGHWSGDDQIGDPSGYGRLCGCDDGSTYKYSRDCELWFDITYNDYDGDNIPYWTEVNVYGTDPEINDTGRDDDGDNVPIEWEWKWEYDPFVWDNHESLDPDVDGVENYEEFLVSGFDSDPFRDDLYIELDQMEESPDGVQSILPDGAKELLTTAYNSHNVVYHIDDGCMGGGEMIPFDELTPRDDLEIIYMNYFLHGDENNWRRGVFRYGVVVYDGTYAGFNFERGSFQISSSRVNKKAVPRTQKMLDIAYASVYMHETGHTLDLRYEGVDNQGTYYPWQLPYWIYGPYRSTMNYRYTYRIVDYSDGSHGPRDYDDWSNIDLTGFQHHW